MPLIGGARRAYPAGGKKDPSLIVVFDEERTLIFEEFDAAAAKGCVVLSKRD